MRFSEWLEVQREAWDSMRQRVNDDQAKRDRKRNDAGRDENKPRWIPVTEPPKEEA